MTTATKKRNSIIEAAHKSVGQVLRTLGHLHNLQTLTEAQQNAYELIKEIDWPTAYYRKDIGYRAIDREKNS